MWILFDLAIVAIIVFSVISGYRKGFVSIMERLLYLVVVCALAYMLKPIGVAVINATPLPQALETKSVEILTEAVGDEITQVVDFDELSNLLSEAALPNALADLIADRLATVEGFLGQNAPEMIAHIASAVTEFVVGAIALIILFVLLSIVYFLVFRILNLTAKLPVVKQANKLLGIAGGLVSATIYVVLIMWLLSAMAPFYEGINTVLSGSITYGLYVNII